ncbi:hypothetical protein F5Y15DRAFT_412451 [Xylariaceae sp. FL0016]|nr:hypothetical protein F5Y15DRAFT_412451 [Xylariaceae sp. FL0016]
MASNITCVWPMTDAEEQACMHLPALAPPSNTVPNYVDPPHNNKLVLGVIGACVGLATIFCGIRAYSKIFCIRRLILEDYLALIGYGFIVAASIQLALMTQGFGLFVHQWNIFLFEIEGFIHKYSLVTIFFCLALMFFKTAILLEWTRFFVPMAVRNTFFWMCHIFIWVNITLYIAIIVAICYTCNPPEKRTRPWRPGTCINVDALNLVASGFNLLLNIIILVLPQQVIWKLKLSSQQRVGVSFIFSIGIITVVCASGRIQSAAYLSTTGDLTYAYSRHLVWGLAEISAAALVFCVPAVPIALRGPQLSTKLTSSWGLKRGMHFSSGTLSPRTPSKLWRQPGRPETTVGVYRRMKEDSQLELHPMGQIDTAALGWDGRVPMHGGILRTTEIITYEEPAVTIPNVYFQEHLHPWIEGKH